MQTATSGSFTCSRSFWVALIIVSYVTIQSFAVGGPYFPLDDRQELFHVNSLGSLWQLLGADAFDLFRPVKNIVFAVFSLFPEDMTPVCRSISIAIGCSSLFPVLALFQRIFINDRHAVIAAAAWMLSPTLVSSVAWLSCVNIQIMCAVAAFAIVLHDKAHENDYVRWRYVAAAAMAIFLACVSYEMAISLCVLVVVFDFYLRPRRLCSRLVLRSYIVYALVSLLYLGIRMSVGAASSINGNFVNATRLDQVFASAYFTCQHFHVWLWPFGKMAPVGAYSPDYVTVSVLVLCWCVVVGLVVLALKLRRSMPLISFGIAFSLVSFCPVSNLLGLGNGPYGDYYMGLPSMGMVVSLVSICAALFSEKGRSHVVCFALGVLLVSARVFAVPEAARWAYLWSNGVSAFKSGIEVFPLAFGNYLLYAEVCFDSGLAEEALSCCDRLEVLLGPDSDKMHAVYMMRGIEAMGSRKDAKDAMRNFDAALKVVDGQDNIGPRRATHYCRGMCFEDLLGDVKSAEVEYRAAIEGRWTSDTPWAADRLARLLAIRGEYDEAEILWRRVARCLPNSTATRDNLELIERKRHNLDVRPLERCKAQEKGK